MRPPEVVSIFVDAKASTNVTQYPQLDEWAIKEETDAESLTQPGSANLKPKCSAFVLRYYNKTSSNEK